MVNGLFQLIKLTGTISGNDIEDITITPALRDTSKAIAFVSFNFSESNDHADTFRSWEILDENTLRIHGQLGDSGNANELDFVAYIMEFGVGVDTQQVNFSQPSNGANPNTGTITSVNLSESALIHSGHNHNAGETTIGSEELERVRLLTSTSWEWEVGNNPNSGPQINRAQVIDWNDSATSVQRGQATLPADTASTTITPPTAIDRTRSILLISFLSDNGVNQDPDDHAISATINGSGDIAISRNDGTSVGAIEINWEIIEFPSAFISVQHLTHTIPSATLSNTDTVTTVGDINNAFAISCVSVPFGFGFGESDETSNGDWGEATATINLTADDTVTFTKDTSASNTTIGYQVVEFLQTITEQIEEFEIDAKLVFEEKFTVDARLSALEEFTVDARLSALAEFTVDGRLAQRELFTVDSRLAQRETFTVDSRLSALAEFTVDARLAQRELFTVDAELRPIQEFTVDGRLAQRELFTVDARLSALAEFTVDARLSALAEFTIDSRLSALAEFDVDMFIELTQVFNFTVDGLIQAEAMKFFLVDAFIQDAFVEDFFIDSRLAQRELFTIDAVIVRNVLFDIDAVIVRNALFDIDAVIVRNKLFDIDARLSALAEFDIDARLAVRELFTIDSRLSALAEFTVDAKCSSLAEFTVDSRLAQRETFDVDAKLVRNELFTVDSRLSALAEFTIDSRLSALAEFTVDAELRPIQEFTIDAFIQVLDQEEEFLVDARLKDLTSVLVIVDAFIQALDQEETFLVDSLIEDTFDEEFLVDSILKVTQQEETFLVDAVILRTGDVLCAGGAGLAFFDDFTTNTGWTNNGGSRIQIDTIAFPNIMRLEFLHPTTQGVLRAHKTFTSPVGASGNIVWEFKHLHLAGGTGFASEFKAELKETTNASLVGNVADETTIRYRTDVVPSTGPEELRLEVFDKNGINAGFSPQSAIILQDNFTYYPRIIKNGSVVKLELYTDASRTTHEVGSPVQVNTAGFDMSNNLNVIWIGNYDTGGPARQAREELDDISVSGSLCPEFTVDSFVQALDQEEEFLVDSIISDAIDKTFLVDGITQGEIEETFDIDSILSLIVDKDFTVDAKIAFRENFTIDATLSPRETFTVDGKLKFTVDKTFLIDGILVDAGQKIFLVDSLLQKTFDETFTVDAILGIFNEETFTVDSFIKAFDTEKTFTIDSRIFDPNSVIFDVDAILKALGENGNCPRPATETVWIDNSMFSATRLGGSGNPTRSGIKNVGTFLDGKAVGDITWHLRRNGIGATGFARATIRSKSDTIVSKSAPINVESLGLSGSPNIVNFTLDKVRLLQDGDRLLLEFENCVGCGSGSPNVFHFADGSGITPSPFRTTSFDPSTGLYTELQGSPTPVLSYGGIASGFPSSAVEGNQHGCAEVDAFIKVLDQEFDFTVDGILGDRFDADFTVDALTLETQTLDFTVDTFSEDIFTKTFLIDGIPVDASSEIFTIDSLIETSDIDKTFTIGAILEVGQIRPFQVDAIVTGAQAKTFTVDAQIFLPNIANFTVDGFLITPATTLDFTVDARIRNTFTLDFTVDGNPTGAGQKIFQVDGLTLGTQTNDFTIDADVRNIKTAVFDVDAVLKLTGDALCSGTGIVFSDSIPNNSGWTNNFTFPFQQIFVDDPLFPGVIRLECLSSRLYTDNQAVKSLGILLESKNDLVWEFKFNHITPCAGFRALSEFSLTETNTLASDVFQGAIKFRITVLGSVNRVQARLEDSFGNVVFTTGIFNLVPDTIYYPRVSITNDGSDLKLEMFTDSARTVNVSTDIVSTAGVTSEQLSFIQVSAVSSGGMGRRAREEFDDITINTSRCPRFDVDARLLGEEEKTFTVDASIITVNNFTVDAFIKQLGDVRCSSDTVIFDDDFTTDAGWTVIGSPAQIQIDVADSNLLRINCMESVFIIGVQQAVKTLPIPVNKDDTQIADIIYEFDHFHFKPCGLNFTMPAPFASNADWALTETNTHAQQNPTQGMLSYEFVPVPPASNQDPQGIRATYSDGTTEVFTSLISLVDNTQYFPRVTKQLNGILKLEIFLDSGRTTHASGSPVQVDASTVSNKQLNFIQVANALGGGPARELKANIDNVIVSQSLCPQVTVDAILGIPEIDFTVDAVLSTQDKFTVDALVQALGDNGCSGALFFDTIDDASPWTVIGGGQINPNDISGVMEWINLRGGATENERFAFRSIPNFADNQGEIRIRVKVDKNADSNPVTPTGRFMVLQNNNLHPNPSTGSAIQLGLGNNGADGGIFAGVDDGTTGITTTPQINFPNGTTKFLEAIYQPVGDTLTLNVYTDANFSVHDIGSPVQVSTVGVSMTGLTFTHLITSNVKNSGPARRIFADLDNFQIGKEGCPTFNVDSIVKALDTEKTFTIDAEITRGKIFLVDSILTLVAEEQFTVDSRLSALEEFNVDAKIAFRKTFTIDGSTLGTADKDFTVDGITIIFPSGLILIDAILQVKANNKVFTVDSRIKAFDTEKDFTVDSQLVQDEIPKQFTIDGRVIVIQTTTFDIDGVIFLSGENGVCSFFPGTNLAVDTGLEQFIGPIQPDHEGGVEQLVGQEVTLSNQQVRSVSFLLRSSNFPNEIIPPMPIDAQIWSGVVVGNFGGETTEAVSTTVINASNTSGDLPPGDWTLVKFEFDVNTTPFLTGDFVVGYRSLSSVFAPAGVGTAIPVISNSNVIDGSAVHRKGSNSILGDLDEWGFLSGDSKDMIIQLEVVNGDDIILGEGNQCPPVDAILVNTPAEPLVDAVLVDRPQEDFIIDGLTSPLIIQVPFEVDAFIGFPTVEFTIDAQIVPSLATFLIDGLILVVPGRLYNIDAVIFGEDTNKNFEVDTFIQAINKNAPLFNINALLSVERTKDFTVDGLSKFFDKVAPFTVDAQVIFFPSQLPQVDGLLQRVGAPKFFFVDALVQKLNQLLFPFTDVDALIVKENIGKTFTVDVLLVDDKTTDFDVDARLSTPGAPKLFSVDALTNLQNGRWQTDALLSKTKTKPFLVDVLIVALPQKLFLIDGITIGEVDEEFIIDGLLQVEAQEQFLVDARILQTQTIDYTVDAIIKDFGVTVDFTVDSVLVRIGEYLVDSFVQALGDGVIGNGNNGGTNDNNTTNPYVQQPTDDNTITLPIGTLVGQRLRLPTAPVRIDDYTFVIHRAGTAGTPTGTLTGKIYKNSIAGNSISGADLIATSDNVVNLASITTNTNGQNVQFTFTNPPETTVDDNVFIGFDIAGSNEQMFLHTESTGTVIDGGDVNIESTGVWGVDLGVDAVLTVNIDLTPRQRASALMHAFVGRFIQEIIGVDALIKAIGGISPSPLGEAEFTVDAQIRFKREAPPTRVDAILIGSQDFTVSAFVGDTLFTGLDVESVIVENNSDEGVESVIVENNSDSGVESVIGQDT